MLKSPSSAQYDATTDTLTLTVTNISQAEGQTSASGKTLNLAYEGGKFTDAKGRTVQYGLNVHTKDGK